MVDNKQIQSFGQVLKSIRQNRKMSQEELAAQSDLDRTYISMLERGIKNPTLNTMFQICKSLEVTPAFMISLMHQKTNRVTSSESIELPLFGTSVSCGKPMGQDYLVEEMLSLEDMIIKNPKETFFVKASGESMLPTIQAGDYLTIEKNKALKSGQIVLAQIENEFMVKRFIRDQKKLILHSDNPLYAPIEVKKNELILICGVVSSIIRLNP